MVEGLCPTFLGMHDGWHDGAVAQANARGAKVWIVWTHRLITGADGHDYRRWTDLGHGAIARLNWGYEPDGTIPQSHRYDLMADRCAAFVRKSEGCHIWVIGNEPNMVTERPHGQPITAANYADCFATCWDRIMAVAGHDQDIVIPAAIAPWNVQTTYPGNLSGDWLEYYYQVLDFIKANGITPKALCWHTYTHGHDANLITSPVTMGPPYQDRLYNFRALEDFAMATPSWAGDLPVYLTEMCPVPTPEAENTTWRDLNNGWVAKAYGYVKSWNDRGVRPHIRAACLYRWAGDAWAIQGKKHVREDWDGVLAAWRQYLYAADGDGDPIDLAALIAQAKRLKGGLVAMHEAMHAATVQVDTLLAMLEGYNG